MFPRGVSVADKVLDYHHNNCLINTAQQLLQKQYGIAGLQDVAQTLSMDVQSDEFVQILNLANSHWVIISTIGCEAGTVNMYDSGENTSRTETESKSPHYFSQRGIQLRSNS